MAAALPLDARLAAAAALVPRGARVADVGCDHGKLAVHLALCGQAARVIAIDVRPAPLARAQKLVESTGCGPLVECRLADGLCCVGPHEVDTVVLAGLSGITICQILAAAPWVKSPDIMVVALPANKPEVLRGWLAAEGFAVLQEQAVQTAGHVYGALAAVWDGVVRTPTELQCWLGLLAAAQDDAAAAYRADALRRARRRLSGESAGRAGRYDEKELRRLRRLVQEMEALCP